MMNHDIQTVAMVILLKRTVINRVRVLLVILRANAADASGTANIKVTLNCRGSLDRASIIF